MKSKEKVIAIIGGGAAGFFAAIRCAELIKEKRQNAKVVIFESSSQFLRKVKISGGGRCNVTHNLFIPQELVKNYPRGEKELLSPLMQFQPKDLWNWFESKGVLLNAEDDGRVFPKTNKSQTIIDCFMSECLKKGIVLKNKKTVKNIKKNDKFALYFEADDPFYADSILMATGSAPSSYRLTKGLGHSVTDLAPSLFTFKILNKLLRDLAGISFPNVKLELVLEGKKRFYQTGPLLITHWGLSGPAVLKLSAWAAREMKKSKYRGQLVINWLSVDSLQELTELLNSHRAIKRKSQLQNSVPGLLPKRFWQQLLDVHKIDSHQNWGDLSKKDLSLLVEMLYRSKLDINGKNRFKEEFVECGGISLKEINLKTMESKLCPGLFFAGEVMDIDGITGGFNFQNAWTTGWIAGENISKFLFG